MTSQHIKADGTKTEVTPKNGSDFSLEELQGFIGGYIEILHLQNDTIMVLNEEGKLIGLPVNPLATIMAHILGRRDLIVGDVLVCDKNMVK